MQTVPIPERICDAYTWRAHYHNGQMISEDDVPGGRGFADVEAERVRALTLEMTAQPFYFTQQVQIPDGASPVFFRRRRIRLDPELGGQSDGGTIHCIGWTRRPEEGGEGVYLFLFEDGDAILTSDFQAV